MKHNPITLWVCAFASFALTLLPFATVRAEVSPGTEGIAQARNSLDLANQWLFYADPRDQGEKAGFMAEAHDVRDWREVTVPCGFGQCVPGAGKANS